MHHGAGVKRFTIAVEDGLNQTAKAFAQAEQISLSRAVARLLRRAVEGEPAPADPRASRRKRRPSDGLPVVRGEEWVATLSPRDIKALDESADLKDS